MTTHQPNPTDDLEAVARCIIGPRNPVPETSPFTLAELRQVAWDRASEAERRDALWAAKSILALCPAGVGEAVAFGEGRVVVDTGKFHGKPAVFIAPVSEPGVVGASARHLGHDKNLLQPGEKVLTFPTNERAKAVADALVGATPAHPDAALMERVRTVLGRARVALPSPSARTGKFAELRSEINALLSDLKAEAGR